MKKLMCALFWVIVLLFFYPIFVYSVIVSICVWEYWLGIHDIGCDIVIPLKK